MVTDDKATAINALIEAVESIERTLGIVPYGIYSDVRVRLDILEARIGNPLSPAPNVTNPFYIDGYGGVSIMVGDGYPTAIANSGSLYLRRDGYGYEGLYSNRDGHWELIPTEFWTAGQDLSGGYHSQTVVGLQNRPVIDTLPLDGYQLTWNDFDGYWEPQLAFQAGGDLSGTRTNQIVTSINGMPLMFGSSPPSDGYVLTWDEIDGYWIPSSLPTPATAAVIFDPLPTSTNIVANRPVNQSTIDNTKVGIVNLGNNDLLDPLSVNGNYGVLLGGLNNIINNDYDAIISGYGNVINGDYSSILDGYKNNVIGNYSSIINGIENNIQNDHSFIGGGIDGYVTGYCGSIIGGILNRVNSNYGLIGNGFNNIVTLDHSTIINGDNNNINGLNSTVINGNNNNIIGNYSLINGSSNTISSDHVIAFGQNHSISSPYALVSGNSNTVAVDADYSSVSGKAAKSRIIGQVVHAVNSLTNDGDSQYSKIILDGYCVSGGEFNLCIPGTSNNISMEDDKSYDIHMRILIVNTGGTPTCARYVYEILAHQQSGVLVLDKVNDTLTDDNGTLWTIFVTTNGGSELIVQVNSSGVDARRAIATIEWLELIRV